MYMYNNEEYAQAKKLCAAVAENNIRRVEKLLKQGANPNILVEKDTSPYCAIPAIAAPALGFVNNPNSCMLMLLRKYGAMTLAEYVDEKFPLR